MAEPLSDAGAGHNGPAPDQMTAAMMFDFLDRHETIVAQRKRLTKAKKDLDEEIEKAGMPIESWRHFLSTREQAGVIRERIDAGWRKLHLWDAKPVGVQAAMDLAAGADGELSEAELARAEREGFETGKAGRKRESNPYTPGMETAQRFDSGWLRGQEALVNETVGRDAEPRRRGRPRKQPDMPLH